MAATNYLDRLLDPVTEVLTPQVARAIADLRADPVTQARVEYLRRRASDGTLTAEEDAEYKDFVDAIDVISILQAKARRFLAKHSP